jgi:predicted RNase H-like HicB family nuclease
MKLRYPVTIFYSKEDRGYIAVVQNLPGCSAFGNTPEDALQEINTAIKLWLEVARKDGKRIPIPAVFKARIFHYHYLPKVRTPKRAVAKKV